MSVTARPTPIENAQRLARPLRELVAHESMARLARLAAVILGEPVTLEDETAPAAVLRLGLVDGDVPRDGPVVLHELRGQPPVALPPSASEGIRALVVLPLAGSAVGGGLYLSSRAPRRWDDTRVAALADLAGSLGAEVELRRHALQDPLTGLPTRSLFLDRLGHAVERGRRHKDFRFAVLVLDLDQFKVINDSLGYHVGDELLCAVAGRLEACIRGEDMVARFAGDEFAILLESLSDDADGGRVADRIQRALAVPMTVGGEEVFVSASIGVALSSSGLEGPPSMLLQSAEIAMSRAKTAGRSRYELFDRTMHARVLGRLRAETELRRAVERNEFELYYQPLVTLDSGRITELEALLRWRHPERGIVPPLEFIPLAEETGLIIPIGRWVLAQACRQTGIWRTLFPRESPLTVSVNLSVKQFRDQDFVAHLVECVTASDLPATAVKLEITESFAIEDPALTRSMLQALRALGVRIYLDDFGTGYSSLAYIHEIPLDGIKIDRSFVTRMDVAETHRQLVHTVRTLAQNIGVAAVAEGVETPAQLDALRLLGCEAAQGFLFSRPVPPAEIEALLRADPRW